MKKLLNFFNDESFIGLAGIISMIGLLIGWGQGSLIILIISLTIFFTCGAILSFKHDYQNEIVRAEYDTENEMMTITLRNGKETVYSRSKSVWYKMPEYERVEGQENLQLLRFYDYNKKFGTYYKK